MRITLPRITSAVLASSAGLWHPGQPVSARTEAGSGVAAAERVAAYRPTWLELTIGPDDDDAGPGLLDAVLPLIGTDPLMVDWGCWFPGAVGGYNGVVLACNTTTRWERQPGVTEVVVSVNYKSPEEVVIHRIAEENGVHLEYLYSE